MSGCSAARPSSITGDSAIANSTSSPVGAGTSIVNGVARRADVGGRAEQALPQRAQVEAVAGVVARVDPPRVAPERAPQGCGGRDPHLRVHHRCGRRDRRGDHPGDRRGRVRPGRRRPRRRPRARRTPSWRRPPATSRHDSRLRRAGNSDIGVLGKCACRARPGHAEPPTTLVVPGPSVRRSARLGGGASCRSGGAVGRCGRAGHVQISPRRGTTRSHTVVVQATEDHPAGDAQVEPLRSAPW